METWMTILTIFIVVFFLAILAWFVYKDYKTKGFVKYTTNIIFKNYNKKIEKVKSLFKNEKLNKILDECKLNIDTETANEQLIFENIKMIDNLEDNYELLKRVQKEFKHKGHVEDKINLLKRPIKIYDLSKFVCPPKHPKYRAIAEFKQHLHEVYIDDDFKKILSATPCYQFGEVFMFLPKNLLMIDKENIFASEIVEYDKINIKVWLKDEEWVDFDGTYNLEETEHHLPENADKNDLNIKEQVKQKNYVLSLSYNNMTYDVLQSEVSLKRQEEMDKLTTKRF